MAYADFTLSGLTKQFNLIIDERTDLFADVSEATLRESFQTQLNQTVPLALAISTEKARSELIIAPILVELWLSTEQRMGLFSGVDFTVDPAKGLVGVCDYILTRSPEQLFVRAPVLMLDEAKNEDMKRGYAQCIAEMLAAQTFNAQESVGQESVEQKSVEQEDVEQEDVESDTVYGAVTLGERWKFLELEGTTVRIDARDYYIERVGKIMGILLHLVNSRLNSRLNSRPGAGSSR